MRLNLFARIPLLLLLMVLLTAIILAGCQILRPYESPLTPTPDQWKGTYEAPNAGQPTIPETWKGEPAKSSLTPTAKEISNPAAQEVSSLEVNHSLAVNEEQASFQIEDSKEHIIQELQFEDICKELTNWWEIFNDPVLNQLEEQALNSSYTLWAALERVMQARALAQVNRAALFPGLLLTRLLRAADH